jgi:hypothetical protein
LKRESRKTNISTLRELLIRRKKIRPWFKLMLMLIISQRVWCRVVAVGLSQQGSFHPWDIKIQQNITEDNSRWDSLKGSIIKVKWRYSGQSRRRMNGPK